jgi:hypothetical protein
MFWFKRSLKYKFKRLFVSAIMARKTFGNGGAEQWSSHLPEEQKIWVRIPPGCKAFRGNFSVV